MALDRMVTSTWAPSGSEDLRVRILVVEHDEFVRETMRMMLNTINSDSADLQAELGIPALNLSVELTGSGEVAWDLMRAKRFDIALIDLNLPGVSGQDLSWCVKQGSVEAHDDEQLSTSHKVASHETILFACTTDDKKHSAALAAYGLHDLLYKPVSVMDLRHVLHKWLPRTGVSAVQQLPQLEQPASLQRNRSGVFAGRVLLVEDDAITRFASELVFQELGLRVDTAEDAHSAMANLAKHDYDLLLLVRARERAASASRPHDLRRLQRRHAGAGACSCCCGCCGYCGCCSHLRTCRWRACRCSRTRRCLRCVRSTGCCCRHRRERRHRVRARNGRSVSSERQQMRPHVNKVRPLCIQLFCRSHWHYRGC